MKTRVSLIVISLILALGLSASGVIALETGPASPDAALGSAFTYQGYLTEGGAPADGTYDFRFRLYDSLEGGSQVGSTLKLATVPVSGGLFSVQLDFGTAPFSGAARWLEVAVRPAGSDDDYTALSPRQALTAAPYALYSRNADLLDGRQASAFASSGHDHLGETWTGIENSLVISGSFGTYPQEAPLRLNNPAGHGLKIDEALWAGVRVDSAGNNGVYVDSAGNNGIAVGTADLNGVSVSSAGLNGVSVNSAVGDGLHVGSAGDAGLQVDSASVDGVLVGSAGWYGVAVYSAGNTGVYVETSYYDGVSVNSAGRDGVSVYSAGRDGLRVNLAERDGVYANTDSAIGEWGFTTPDKILANNFTTSSLSLLAQVAGPASLSPGDLAAAVGLGEPAPGGTIRQPLVAPASQGGDDGLIGVVASCMAYVSREDQEAESDTERLQSVPGPCQPGSYIALTVLGVAEVRVDPAAEFQPGMRLTASAVAGAARSLRSETLNGMTVNEGAPVLGIALEAPQAGEQTIPVFVTLR